MQPTAALLMKDTELNRIVDNDQRYHEKANQMIAHYDHSRAMRSELGII